MDKIHDYLMSKVGQAIRVNGVQNMTTRGKNHVRDYLQQEYIAENSDHFSPDDFVDYTHYVSDAIAATGDQLSTPRGKWTTRFRKELKLRGIRITDQQLGRIGDAVMMYTESDGPWFIDIVNKFDWDSGDFCDENSCFWTCRSNNRDIMEFYQGLAIRTYHSDSFEDGNGRAWICKPNGQDYSVIFNAYGKRLDKFVQILNRLVSMDKKELYSAPRRCYNSIEESQFWVNQNECYTLSLKPLDISDALIDLKYDNVHGDYFCIEKYGHPAMCSDCGCVIHPTEAMRYADQGRVKKHATFNVIDKIYCLDCIQKYDARYCGDCRTFHPHDHFLHDLQGHEVCVFQAHWVTLCDNCGYIGHHSHDDFGSYLKFDVSKAGLQAYCYNCSGSYGAHYYNALYGPMCGSCMDDLWYKAAPSNVSSQERLAIFSHYGLKCVREEE